MRSTKERLNNLLLEIAKFTNQATTKEEAIEKNLNGYLYLDNYPMYGGYNLLKVDVNNGGHYTAFNSFSSYGNRLPAKVMIEKMESFIDGLKEFYSGDYSGDK